ncbi:hypothetical protein QDR37_10085 [Amnibacterium sp. CER49]|uniref:hypothetical protein n=1 Tax=Amnibacterium sp. CER49 TaxID=3039161 RepID=UPI00244B8484|nr:hypothetical protein [Amnibacterium sp. CER49]MDH2444289.1 hypothetical protein [Amnibacterium sp. CER49]
MRLLRRSHLVLAATAAAATVAAVVVGGVPSASAATAYSVTYAGTDAHTLDPNMQPKYTGGGGVGAVVTSSGPALIHAVEFSVNLPVGARVTSVAVSYSTCNTTSQPVISFGVDTPASASSAQIAAISAGTHCGVTTVSKAGSPLTTVLTGRRYVVDFTFTDEAGYSGPFNQVLYGTTVKYTCDAPCVA